MHIHYHRLICDTCTNLGQNVMKKLFSIQVMKIKKVEVIFAEKNTCLTPTPPPTKNI